MAKSKMMETNEKIAEGVVASYKKIEEGVWRRVLFVPTGALLSKTSFNEGQSIPGIAHAIVLEHYKG